MTDFNPIQWMQEKGFAKNDFQAAHIANGLKLTDCIGDPQEQKRRVIAYRVWRRATKDKPSICYDRVLNGEEPPKEMFRGELQKQPPFDEALHSEPAQDGRGEVE